MADREDFATAVGALIKSARWIKRDLVAGEDLNALTEPGEYVAAPYSVSSTLLNGWSPYTGSVIVHPQYGATAPGVRYVTQERTIGASSSGDPARRATRSLRGDGTWSPWVEERAEARAYADARLVDAKAYTDSVAGTAFPDRTKIAALGDSLTDGGSGGTVWPEEQSWPARMGAALGAGYTVTNAGWSGATVDEMMMRCGVMPVRVTVPAAIVKNANAVVTPVGTYALPAGQSRTIDMKWGTNNARIIVSAAGVWTLYNYATETVPAGTVTLGAQFPNLAGQTVVVWIGRNDITFGTKGLEATVPDHVIAGHQRVIEWLTPRAKHVLILGVTPRSNESAASTNGLMVKEINDRLQQMFPGKFASVLTYLQGQALTDLGITPTTADQTAITENQIPPSLLASGDNTHITPEAARVVGENFVRQALSARGWL